MRPKNLACLLAPDCHRGATKPSVPFCPTHWDHVPEELRRQWTAVYEAWDRARTAYGAAQANGPEAARLAGEARQLCERMVAAIPPAVKVLATRRAAVVAAWPPGTQVQATRKLEPIHAGRLPRHSRPTRRIPEGTPGVLLRVARGETTAVVRWTLATGATRDYVVPIDGLVEINHSVHKEDLTMQHPLDDEIAEVHAAHSELAGELDEMERQLDAGELEGVDHDEMRRRTEALEHA